MTTKAELEKKLHKVENSATLLTFGIIGFTWIMFVMIYTIYLEKKWNSYFFILVLSIFILSMLNEDTLETHVGVSMVSFFYSLFLFGYKNNIKPRFVNRNTY